MEEVTTPDPTKGTKSWWRGRTGLEKVLLFITIFPVVLLVVLLTVIIIISADQRSSESEHIVGGMFPKSDVCTTPGCVKAAYNLMSAMNTSVDPCENFYEFACGSFKSIHPMPDDKSAYGSFHHVREQVSTQLRGLLEQTIVSPSRSVNMARTVYSLCMNKKQLDELKTSPLLKTLDDLGKWPLLQQDEWREENFRLTDLLAVSGSDYGTDVFFEVSIYADTKNTSRNTLFVDQGSLALGRGTRDYYLNSTRFAFQMMAYAKYMREISGLLKLDGSLTRSDADIERDVSQIIDFEKELAKIVVAEDERRNSTRLYNKRTIADLYEYLPHVDWVRYFYLVAPPELTSYFNNETEVIVCEIEYLKKIEILLSKTDKVVLSNYIIWRVVKTKIAFLDERFEDIRQDFTRVMTGQQQKSAKWKECAQVPMNVLPLATGAIYVNAHFDPQDKKEAMEMISHLRESFIKLVKANDWMDQATKDIAIEKANSMINNIGYPDLIKDENKLDEEYKDLHIEPSDTYYSSMKKATIWINNKQYRKLLKDFDRTEFETSPAVVNAFYSPEKNSITFPAGILQPPFFSGIYPKAVNYGAIGAVIGHEITHGFDDQGSQFDKNGNLHDWWSEDSLKNFDERRRCIVDQYGNYTLPKTTFKINGKLTQGENIADNGGVKESFRAYEQYIAQNGEEPRLPGLQAYSNQQIFFISYAHFWCGEKKEAAAIQQVLTDEHSPELFRVIGVMSNMKEFSDAFQCKAGTPLNPPHKCVVW